MAEQDTLSFSRRRIVLTAIVALVLVVVVVGAIGEIASWHRILHALDKANRQWFPVCFAGEVFAYVGYVLAYRDVARSENGPQFSYWTATRIVFVGFGAFIAGSSAGTLGVDYWALTRAGEKPHDAARRVLALNTLEWGILACLAASAGGLSVAQVGAGVPLGMAIGWLAVVPLCILAALWVTAPGRVERFTALPRPVERPAARRPLTWLRWIVRAVRAGLADAIGGVVLVRKIVRSPGTHPHAVLGFLVFWVADIIAMDAALRAFGAHLGVPALVLAYTSAYVITSLPLPAGGAGGVEAGLAASLDAVGVPLEAALLATLVYRFFTLWLPIGVAAVFLPQFPKLAAELPGCRRRGEPDYASAHG